MEYLTLEDALYIHAEQLRLFGGAEGVRDLGLIESALLRPQTGYYADLVEQAAALWESLAMNHGFIDGNSQSPSPAWTSSSASTARGWRPSRTR